MEGLVEYLVLTECGRRFGWSTTGLERLFREMEDRNYRVRFVMTMKEYEESKLKNPA